MESLVWSEPCTKQDLSSLVGDIQTLGIIKFGQFTLRTGASSSFYLDFRESFGHPKLFRQLGFEMAKLAENLDFDLLAGVPYAAVPLATSIALSLERPLLLCRKEAKKYGQKKIIDGIYTAGETCLLIEDVITTGASILETADILRSNGLIVNDCISLVCREKTALENLKLHAINLHTVFQMEQLLHVS